LSAYLLDTNAALLLAFRPSDLRRGGLDELAAGARRISHVCSIEMAIKQSLGKLDLPAPFQTDFTRGFLDMAAGLKADIHPIELRHIDRLSRLPFFHRDPFDRLLICQALEDNLTLVTRDRAFSAYPGVSLFEI
jgi:PIN domain nuclease of toxin-antitoxin system